MFQAAEDQLQQKHEKLKGLKEEIKSYMVEQGVGKVRYAQPQLTTSFMNRRKSQTSTISTVKEKETLNDQNEEPDEFEQMQKSAIYMGMQGGQNGIITIKEGEHQVKDANYTESRRPSTTIRAQQGRSPKDDALRIRPMTNMKTRQRGLQSSSLDLNPLSSSNKLQPHSHRGQKSYDQRQNMTPL